MLVSDIVRRVRNMAGDTNVLQFNQTTLTDWINDGIRECVKQHSLLQARGTSDTVAGQPDYNLPSNIYKLHSVYYDGKQLQILTLEQWEKRMQGTVVGDGPSEVCYVFAGSLTLSPTPDSVVELQINYTKLPTAITYAVGPPETWNPSTPDIPEAFHNRLVTYCLAQVALQDEDNYKYNMLMQEFTTGMVSLGETKNEDDLYPMISVSNRDMGDWFPYDWEQ